MVRLSVLVVALYFIAGCSNNSKESKTAGPVAEKSGTPIPTTAVTVTASSLHPNAELGPQGLWSAKAPGWHSQPGTTYPQVITSDLSTPRVMHRIGLFPQEGQLARAPKAVEIEVSEDGYTWRPIGSTADACQPNTTDGWYDINLPSEITSRYLRLRILSNCGDPNLLTLQGLRAL
jgi:hypothetical protein